ncbi:hypothetical protein JV197_10935, partial [Vibrio furnissii]
PVFYSRIHNYRLKVPKTCSFSAFTCFFSCNLPKNNFIFERMLTEVTALIRIPPICLKPPRANYKREKEGKFAV